MRMIEEGIIPYDWPRNTLEPGFNSLTEEEHHTVRRKFRKLWRKALKYHSRSNVVFHNLSQACGVGLDKNELRSIHHLQRAKLVYDMLKVQAGY